MVSSSKFTAFDQGRSNPASFTLSETRADAQEYRFDGKLTEALTENISLTSSVLFSLASRDGAVTVEFLDGGDVRLLLFEVEPGIPLVFEIPSFEGEYPASWVITPASTDATIELLTFTESPEEEERFIWLRSGYGVETAFSVGETRVVSWRDTRETALARDVWGTPGSTVGLPAVIYSASDPAVNGAPSLEWWGSDVCTLEYQGTDLDALTAGDYTVMFVASTPDDGNVKIAWATENMVGGVQGISIGMEGGYRTVIPVRESGNTGLADQIAIETDEIGEKLSVWIVEYRGTNIFLYRQGMQTPENIILTADGGGLKKFRIGGAQFGISLYAPWIGKIVDIRVHNRLLTQTEKSNYLSYARDTYGVDDSAVPVFPWVTGSTKFFRANRGVSSVSELFPTAASYWADTRYEAAPGQWISTDSPQRVPQYETSSSAFNGQPAIVFDGGSPGNAGSSRMAFSGAAGQYNFMAGGTDFSFGIVFRNRISEPGGVAGPGTSGYTLFSSKIAETVGGLHLGWTVGSYQANELQARIRRVTGSWGNYWLAAMDTTPEVATAAVVRLDSGSFGTLTSPSEQDDALISGTADATAATPFLGADTSTDTIEERNKFVGEVVEMFWIGGTEVTDEDLQSYRDYLSYRYGIT